MPYLCAQCSCAAQQLTRSVWLAVRSSTSTSSAALVPALTVDGTTTRICVLDQSRYSVTDVPEMRTRPLTARRSSPKPRPRMTSSWPQVAEAGSVLVMAGGSGMGVEVGSGVLVRCTLPASGSELVAAAVRGVRVGSCAEVGCGVLVGTGV